MEKLKTSEIFDKVKKIIEQKFDWAEGIDKIKPESDFYNDFGFDSFDMFELTTEIEIEFGIILDEVDPKEMSSLQKIADLVNLIQKTMN